MKSNLKSYRVRCQVCGILHKVAEVIMQSYRQSFMLYCLKCQAHTEHKKVD